jgi:putative Mg2+ transporter-C (MgtC) family protein
MTASAGMYAVATAATVMVLVCLEGMNFIHHHVFKHPHHEFDVDENNDNQA